MRDKISFIDVMSYLYYFMLPYHSSLKIKCAFLLTDNDDPPTSVRKGNYTNFTSPLNSCISTDFDGTISHMEWKAFQACTGLTAIFTILSPSSDL